MQDFVYGWHLIASFSQYEMCVSLNSTKFLTAGMIKCNWRLCGFCCLDLQRMSVSTEVYNNNDP